MKLKLNRSPIRLALTAWSLAALLVSSAYAAVANEKGNRDTGSAQPVFARVGKAVITQREYDTEFISSSRARFYHGRPPEAEIALLQREIGDKLITDVLLFNEAKRLKLKPDAAAVKQKLEQYEQSNAKNQQWQNIRERALPALTKQFEAESLRSKLEQQVRKVPAPNDQQLRAYYTSQPDKFTEPEQLRVSVILLKIDPSSPQAAWDAANKKAGELALQLRGGADFAEAAALYSGDAETVEQGGDMGYLHGGMLPELAQGVINKLKSGEISDPIALMEGIAIFKLTDRKEAKLNSFELVAPRARELYLIDAGERAWKSLIANLKKKTPIKVDESRYLPLPKPAAAAPVAAEPATSQPGSTSAAPASK